MLAASNLRRRRLRGAGDHAAAVYAGHRYAQELELPADCDRSLRHDRVDVGLES
jgi:hypothetical protein